MTNIVSRAHNAQTKKYIIYKFKYLSTEAAKSDKIFP